MGMSDIEAAAEKQLVRVAEVHDHPEYNAKTLKFDISVLELETSLAFEGYKVSSSCPHSHSLSVY